MRDTVLTALQAIAAGATPDSQEHEHLDFKEDPARSAKPATNPEAARAQMLLDAAICFANSDGESFIVLGLRDKASGAAAFTGTDADPGQIMSSIFNRTSPNLTVEATVEEMAGSRLVVVRVPQGLSVYCRKDGAATRRQDTRCVPMSDTERHHLRHNRLNPDPTALQSSLQVNDLDVLALDAGIRKFNDKHPDDTVSTPEEMLRRLGLASSRVSGLKRAACILFAPPPPGHVVSQHLWRPAPGEEPERNDVNDPLILTIPKMLARIQDRSNAELERVELPTGQERQIPDFPGTAVDEVVLNAFAHRDWDLSGPVVVEQSPQALSVSSPGGLPVGVDPNRLLTTESTPRNRALMQALHHLGLVEQTSRGFDRMWRSMLSSGRQVPQVETDDFHVRVTFTASVVDTAFVKALSLLPTVVDERYVGNVNVLLSLKELTQTNVLTEVYAAELLQLSKQECRSTLRWLVQVGLLTTNEAGNLWSLSPKVLTILREQGVDTPPEADIQGWIVDAVKRGAVTNRQVVAATGARPKVVTAILRHLANTGAVTKEPTGPQRGPQVRWVAVRRDL